MTALRSTCIGKGQLRKDMSFADHICKLNTIVAAEAHSEQVEVCINRLRLRRFYLRQQRTRSLPWDVVFIRGQKSSKNCGRSILRASLAQRHRWST